MTAVDRSLKSAKNFAKSGDINAANAVYMQLLTQYPENKRAQQALRELEVPVKGKKRDPNMRERLVIAKALQEHRLNDALDYARGLVKTCGPSLYLYNCFGIIYEKAGNYAQAGAHFNQAISIRPNDPDVLANFGQCLKNSGHHNDAIKVLNHAIFCDMTCTAAHTNLGNVYSDMGETEKAIACFKTASKLEPGLVAPIGNIGNAYRDAGDKEKAAEYYEAALSIKPDYADAFHNLTILKKFTADDPIFGRIKEALKTNGASVYDQSQLYFALGKAYNDLGDYDSAFAGFENGNKIWHDCSGFIEKKHLNAFALIRRAAHDDLPVLDAEPELPSRPIFILGMPRSGTSLVEQIISSHSDVYGGGELPHFAQSASPALLTLENNDVLPDADALRTIRKAYYDCLSLEKQSPVFTDKMPMNFRWISIIKHALPEAVIIHTKRDPMAICWSIYRRLFPAKGIDYQSSLDALVFYYKEYEKMMAFWEEKYPGAFYTLNYERLTENQEEETRKLIDICGLSWQDACLQFEKNKRIVRTASSQQVRQGMYQASSQEWQKYEYHLGPLMEGLGIAPTH